MFKMTKAIYETLKNDEGLKVFTDEAEGTSCAWLQFGIKNGGSYRIRFINTDDDNDTAVRVYSLLSVEGDQKDKVFPVLNKLNRKYRFVKFVMDDDGDINVEYDYPVSAVDPSKSAKEIVIRIVSIIDKAYPDLMHAMWA